MQFYRLGLSLMAVTFVTVAFADDFDDARQKIGKAKPNIDYKAFCIGKPAAGLDKIACRIKEVPTVGFLVCKKPEIDGEHCRFIIRKEVDNIETVRRGGVNTVKISTTPIDDVKCGGDPSLSCSGFLEGWVASDTGTFKQVGDLISSNTIPQLIADVKGFTSKAGLPKTAADLTKIKNYMMVNVQANKYRQICDLQGFFLVQGGFLVADVPYILQDATIDGVCPSGSSDIRQPTTQEVLDALDQMISAFKGK